MIYTAVFSVLAAMGLTLRSETQRVWLMPILLALLIFMGTRYYVGCDFTGYLVRYEYAPVQATWYTLLTRGEPLFEILVWGTRILGLDYMWLNFAASAIILACFWVFLRTHENAMLILALLFPVVILQLGMSGIRQAIAVAMLMVATTQWLMGRRLMTALWILLGAQFHSSVLIFLPISLLAGRQISTVRLIVAAGLLTPVAGVLLADRLGVYVDRYVTQVHGERVASGAFIRYALNIIPIPFFLLLREKIAEHRPELYQLLKLFAVVIIAILPLGVLSSIALDRMTYYIMPFSILIFIISCEAAFLMTQRRLGYVLPLLVYGGYMLFWLNMSRHANECYFPYQTYLLQ